MTDDPPSRSIEVVAGVIRDARGRILLARRTEGRDLAGSWEFPGGKREPGESAEAALIRELHEELGIQVEVGEAVIAVPQRYPDKRLRLDVRHIRHWRGKARGLEGQALAWVPPHKLSSYVMPPADRPVVAALERPDRYLVTPAPAEGRAGGQAWLRGLEQALAAGIGLVQLRAPGADSGNGAEAGAGWSSLVAQAAALCRDAGAQALVNGDIGLAREHGIGLHLRAAQLTTVTLATAGERLLPAGQPLAASCHGVDELLAAEALGCDFAVVGTLKPSASHPGVAGIGWEGFARLREYVSLPLYAIGGLGPDDIAEARTHGAQGIAAIRSLWPLSG